MKALALLLTLFWTVTVQASLSSIELSYNSAEDLLPAIQPLLQDNERISGHGNLLLLNAPEQRHAEILALIRQLDRPARRLRISVINDSNQMQSSSGYRIDGSTDSNPQVIIGQPRQNTNEARIIRRQTLGSGTGTRQILASEGRPVLIHSGQSVPLTSISTDQYGRPQINTEYRDALQGFYATVRLHGSTASIDIETRQDSVNQGRPGTIDMQRSNTRVSVPLGQWVTIGNLDDSGRDRESDIGRRINTRNQQNTSIRLMVEALD